MGSPPEAIFAIAFFGAHHTKVEGGILSHASGVRLTKWRFSERPTSHTSSQKTR